MLKNKLGYGETARKYKMYSSPERGFRRNGNKIPGGVTTTIYNKDEEELTPEQRQKRIGDPSIIF